MIEISSVQNPKIKKTLKLLNRKERDETGLFLIEGEREIRRAFETGFPIEALYFSRSFFHSGEREALVDSFQSKGIELYSLTEAVFRKLSYRENPDGLLAVARQVRKGLSDLDALLKTTDKPLLLVAESLEKPGNLGTILRSCDGCGVHALILADQLTDIFNPNVVRASMGTLFSIPIIEAEGKDVLEYLNRHQIAVFAATPEGASEYTRCDYTQGSAFVVGSEHAGLSKLFREQADKRVFIPMHGIADSLNVSVAATLLIYEAVRQRSEAT
ncbi:TrmH family RNA methyltransferase [Estrella lausannensis]|uniref:rRNA methylase, SpoU family n=1 Tax=Estrella lausannensis TaxID=483423 RepID=A0A0H5DQ29_9BACT|nr:RNA methyltransferase [Estrella lausannensis]CRX38736.1 rRNA methylase, SpoU family [Estrella lausannensis]